MRPITQIVCLNPKKPTLIRVKEDQQLKQEKISWSFIHITTTTEKRHHSFNGMKISLPNNLPHQYKKM